MGYDIISSWHIHGSLKQKLFPFAFNGFFMATLQPMNFQNATFMAMKINSRQFHDIFMAFSWGISFIVSNLHKDSRKFFV